MLTRKNGKELKCMSAENIKVSSATVALCSILRNVLKSQHPFLKVEEEASMVGILFTVTKGILCLIGTTVVQ